MATMAKHLTQAYHQAPWRIQMQWIGFFLVGLVIVAIIAGVYLSITAQTTAAGIEIQDLEAQRDVLKRKISDMTTQLADLTSEEVMTSRAHELGFEQIDPETATYMVIAAYPGRQPALLAPLPGPNNVVSPLIKPSYTISLWEWLFQHMTKLSEDYAKGITP